MPGTDAAVVEAPVSTLDVVATIRAVTGASGPAVPGRDLREVAANPDAFADRAVISQARGEDDDAHCRRFAARSGSATVFAEYDTESGGTSFGGDTEADEVVAELRDHIDSHGGDQYGTVDDSSDEDVDDEIEDRLSALGYK
jgi:arylsulfatase